MFKVKSLFVYRFESFFYVFFLCLFLMNVHKKICVRYLQWVMFCERYDLFKELSIIIIINSILLFCKYLGYYVKLSVVFFKLCINL